MRPLLKYTAAFIFLFFVTNLYASSRSPDEEIEGLSLEGSTLTIAPPDDKAPEHGAVTAKYGFRIAKDFLPYLGTGIAYSYQPDSITGDITNIRTGVAAQIGFNYFLDTSSTLKLEYKYLSLPPEQTQGDSRVVPQSIGIGLDIKF